MDNHSTLRVSISELTEGDAESLGELLGMDGSYEHERPSYPVMGLPLRRLVPQDAHSLLDYASGLALIAAGLASGNGFARTAGTVLGSTLIGVSLLTDYRMSVRKIIPIELHEVGDYVGGLSAVAAPFALGYHRTSKLAAWVHVATGVATVVTSLFTDYRASRGVSLR